MLTTLLDFFCSRPFADAPTRKQRIFSLVQAIGWFLVALIVGCLTVGDLALPGENAEVLATFSGAMPADRTAYPLLWGAVRLFAGATPSMAALNLFGAALMGALLGVTWLVVKFWVTDAMQEDSVARAVGWLSSATGHIVCALLLFSLTGWLSVSGLTLGVWNLLWLLLCVALQNSYAMNGGKSWQMALFAGVLGVAAMESPWVMLMLPLFFMRTLAVEWRLWDHSVRNLPLWFCLFVTGSVLFLLGNTLRMTDALSLHNIVATELTVLRVHLRFVMGWLGGPWLFLVAGAVLWPLLGWITARQLLNNARSWALLHTALVLSLVGMVLYWGNVKTAPLPLFYWLASGQVPLATTWAIAVASGMLLAGWGVQLFAPNPNRFEERDRRYIPQYVTAMRVASMALFPLSVIAAGVTLCVQTWRFAQIDRGMMQRFAAETIALLKDDAAALSAGKHYVLSTAWQDCHLMLEAQKAALPLTFFSIDRATAMDNANHTVYLATLSEHLKSDPRLGAADRLRLTHLLDYNFITFVYDFFVAQENVAEIAVALDQPEVWYASRKKRPYPCGTLYAGVPEDDTQAPDPLPIMTALQARWAETLKPKSLPWWDPNVQRQRDIRHHLAFMSNNLGTYLDDIGRIPEAANCYYYALKTDPENISALLNSYAVCIRRGYMPERAPEINRLFQDFITSYSKSRRQASLELVRTRFGYIRDAELFMQLGWDWVMKNSSDSLLAGLRNAQRGLSPTDPRNAAFFVLTAAFYEHQRGQTHRSQEYYIEAVKLDPKNVDALRGLARLSMQNGKIHEAGKWLAQAEAAGADADAMDIDRTAYLMAIGDLEEASKTIGRYTTNHKDATVGWAMLGMLEIQRGNPDRAGGFILENIKRTIQGRKANERDIYFQHVLEGRLAQYYADEADAQAKDMGNKLTPIARQDAEKRARDLYATARDHYRRAYTLRPNVIGLLELILDFDRRLGEKAAAETDALAILREDERHAFANFIVGSQRAEDGEVETAVKYFRKAIERTENPRFDLLNNYADALARTDPELAKDVGLRCIQAEPQQYLAWGTYALALARCGLSDQAAVAIKKARELAKEANQTPDPRMDLADIWICIKRGDKAEARKLTEQLKRTLGAHVTMLDSRDFREIDQALDNL